MESIVVEESVYRSQYSSDKKSCTSKWNDPKPVFNNPTFGSFLGSATILIKKKIQLTIWVEPMMV